MITLNRHYPLPNKNHDVVDDINDIGVGHKLPETVRGDHNHLVLVRQLLLMDRRGRDHA